MVCGSALITSSRPLHTWQCIGLSCVLFTIVLQHESLVFIVSYAVVYRCFFFFFQAEDGIRDIGVTGVQTCALPIYTDALVERVGLGERAGDKLETLSLGNQQRAQIAAALVHDPEVLVLDEPFRSEERRVGKECRSRWSPYH